MRSDAPGNGGNNLRLHVASVSRETVRRALHRLEYRWRRTDSSHCFGHILSYFDNIVWILHMENSCAKLRIGRKDAKGLSYIGNRLLDPLAGSR